MTSAASPDSAAKERRFGDAAFLPWLVLAGAVVAMAWLTQLYFVSRGEAALLQDQVALTQLSLRSAQQELEAERIVGEQRWHSAEQAVANLVVAPLAPPVASQPGTGAVAWSAATEQGVLMVENLPRLNGNEVYQVWIRDAQRSEPINAGSFTVTPTAGAARVVFKPGGPVVNATGFAVTREPQAGATTPGSEIVLSSRGASL